MKKIILLFSAVFCLAGCATANIERMNTVQSPVLTGQEKVFVALPRDGAYQNVQYTYSGQQVQQAFFEELSHYAADVVLGNEVMSLETAQAQAKKVHAQVLFYPVITHWEDRNTPWSGLRDKVRVNVQVYSVGTDKVLDRTSLYATNRWFAFVNAAPANLLKKIVNPYLKQLYQ